MNIKKTLTSTIVTLGVAASSLAQTAIKDTAIKANNLERVAEKDVFTPITKDKFFNKFISSDTLTITCPCGDTTQTDKVIIKVAEYATKKDTMKVAILNVVGDKKTYKITGSDPKKSIKLENTKNVDNEVNIYPHKNIDSLLKKNGIFFHRTK